jgi:molybdopterin converting factor small subunit
MATVLIFGELKDITQTGTVGSLPSMTVGDMRNLLAERWPALHNKTFLVAVNQRLAADEVHIPEDAEVALMPPFSGG